MSDSPRVPPSGPGYFPLGIRTANLRLSQWSSKDIPELAAVFATDAERLSKWVPLPKGSNQVAATDYVGRRASWNGGRGPCSFYCARDAESGSLFGSIDVTRIDADQIELGCWRVSRPGASHWTRELVGGVSHALLTEGLAQAVYVRIDSQNASSLRLAADGGFRQMHQGPTTDRVFQYHNPFLPSGNAVLMLMRDPEAVPVAYRSIDIERREPPSFYAPVIVRGEVPSRTTPSASKPRRGGPATGRRPAGPPRSGRGAAD